MSYDTILNNWLVPATDDKLVRKKSEEGRILQGRKGIGRFAASILGERILVETTCEGKTTSLILDMEELSKLQYLDQFELTIETRNTGKSSGTIIEIEKDHVAAVDVQNIWTLRQLRKLLLELRSLTAPDEVYQIAENQGFHIYHDTFDMKLVFNDFPVEEYSRRTIDITPFPILDLYDYKISGTVNAEGLAKLEFKNQNHPGLPPDIINISIPLDQQNNLRYPGNIFLDFRVYDRESSSIDNMIKRGLKDPETGEYVGKREARKILDESYGIGIYREQFRVRPYGEQSFDWLDLDKKRVQAPSVKLGYNQVLGFVYIRSEEESGLIEKSARDGLMENTAYFGLQVVVLRVINELEARRNRYRKQERKGGRNRSIEDDINLLFDFDNTKQQISKELEEAGVPKSHRKKVDVVVGKVLTKEKEKKSVYAKKILDSVAIYQGQATLGKITHVLLHEGRKHIKYISETTPRIVKWAKQLTAKSYTVDEDKIRDRSDKLLLHTKGLSFLFNKIEPLARTRRAPKRELNLSKELDSIFAIFAAELESSGISVQVECAKNIKLFANEMDVITIFSNLIENSVFWLGYLKDQERVIEMNAFRENNTIIVEYADNGPGFQGTNLELMFEPGYSMKPEGTGLGLALAGEAISRIGGSIEAKHSDKGAVFELVFKEKKGV
jgi:hypothetical protein